MFGKFSSIRPKFPLVLDSSQGAGEMTRRTELKWLSSGHVARWLGSGVFAHALREFGVGLKYLTHKMELISIKSALCFPQSLLSMISAALMTKPFDIICSQMLEGTFSVQIRTHSTL